MKPTHSRRVGNGLVGLSSAAVLAVFAAGYARTQTAAANVEAQDVARVQRAPLAALPPLTPAAAPVAAKLAARPTAAPAAKSAPLDAVPMATETPAAAIAPPQVTKVEIAPAAAPAPTAGMGADAEVTLSDTNVVAPPPPPAPAYKFKDGTFSGWGSSRHGSIEAEVVIADGRITSARITQCLTRYSCVWIARLPPQVVARQSPDVDYVSGATQSTDAFYGAVVQALRQALIP